jgi:hypothetical protein
MSPDSIHRKGKGGETQRSPTFSFFYSRFLGVVPEQALGDVLEEPFEHAGPNRVLQLGNRFGLDLPYSLPGHFEDSPDFLESVREAVGQTVTEPDDLAFSVGKRFEKRIDSIPEYAVVGVSRRTIARWVFDELPEDVFIPFSDRSI